MEKIILKGKKHKINALSLKCAELEVQRENLMVVHGQNHKEITDKWLTKDGQIVGIRSRDGRNCNYKKHGNLK